MTTKKEYQQIGTRSDPWTDRWTETDRQMESTRTDIGKQVFLIALKKVASNPLEYSPWNTVHGIPTRFTNHQDSTSTSTTTSKTITTTITAATTTTTTTITLADTNKSSNYCREKSSCW